MLVKSTVQPSQSFWAKAVAQPQAQAPARTDMHVARDRRTEAAAASVGHSVTTQSVIPVLLAA